MKPIALVTPWFGDGLIGGAEQQSNELVKRLAARGIPVEVLTTCSRSFDADWGTNAYAQGVESLGDSLTVRRFRVDRRDRRQFARVADGLTSKPTRGLKRGVNALTASEEQAFVEHNIRSSRLTAFLQLHGADYRAVLFIPYLYGTTLDGLPLVADRAFLQPCLHDEGYAYVGAVAKLFYSAAGLFFNSAGEFELAQRLYGPGIIDKSTVVGEGVSVARPSRDIDRVGDLRLREEPYLLYLGRQEVAKNVNLLVAAYEGYRHSHFNSRLKLVLAGDRRSSFAHSSLGVIDAGRVSEDEKNALLEHCTAFVQPSTNESFSRAMYEAWMYGRPVVANAGCSVTADPVARCDGGWIAASRADWEQVFSEIEASSEAELAARGERGRAYAVSVASWDEVTQRYVAAFDAFDAREPAATEWTGSIYHVVAPGQFSATTSAIAMRDALRSRGVASDLVADNRHLNDGSPVILHEISAASVPHIPPAQRVLYASSLNGSRVENYLTAFASTRGVAEHLRQSGFGDVQLVPTCVDPRIWDREPDEDLSDRLQDGCTNLVFVGELSDWEEANDLVRVFLNYLSLERDSRLVVAAIDGMDDAVYERLRGEILRLELQHRMSLARHVTGPQLHAIYSTAALFLSLNHRDTHGMRYVEAMWFDIPVLARKTPVSDDIVGDCSVLMTDQTDIPTIAGLAHVLVHDKDLRTKILAAQRKKRLEHHPDMVVPKLLASIAGALGKQS